MGGALGRVDPEHDLAHDPLGVDEQRDVRGHGNERCEALRIEISEPVEERSHPLVHVAGGPPHTFSVECPGACVRFD